MHDTAYEANGHYCHVLNINFYDHQIILFVAMATERGRPSGLLTADDFTNGELDDYSPSPSARSSPAPSTRYKYSRFVID